MVNTHQPNMAPFLSCDFKTNIPQCFYELLATYLWNIGHF